MLFCIYTIDHVPQLQLYIVCTCRNYHFNKSNATGTINVAETAYTSGIHEFTAFISRDRVAELYSFSIY